MQVWLRSKLCWGILLASGAGLVLCCRGRDHNPRLPPAEDAFLSYLQAAHGLATLLLHPSPLRPSDSPQKQQDQIARACEELEKLQTEAEALSPDEIQRLTLAEKNLVAQTRRAWDELSRRHAASPNFPGADWTQLEAAFRLCRKLNQPTK